MENLFVRIKGIDNFTGTFAKAEASTGRLGKATRIAAGVAVVGLAAITYALYKCTKAAIEDQIATAQTNAVLKSTGGIANVTAKEVDALGNSMALQTGISDEAIVGAQNLLLTFTNIRNEVGKGNDIFTQATKITADLSVRLGKDLNSSAIMVGKALQDPIRGAIALRRAGVQLSDQQKQQIKDFMAVGDIMGAQKIILKELNIQMGGAAEAYGETWPGKLKRLGEALDQIKERIGKKVLGALIKFADWLLLNWPTIEKTIVTSCKVILKVWNGIQKAAEALGNAIGEVVYFIQSRWAWLKNTGTAIWLAIQWGIIKPMQKTYDFLRWVWDNTTAAIRLAWNIIKLNAQIAWLAIQWAIIKPIELVARLLTIIWNGISGALIVIWNGIYIAASFIFGAVKDFCVAVWNGIAGAWSGAWGAISGVVRGAWNGIVGAYHSTVGWLSGAVSGVWGGISGAWSGAWSGITGALAKAWDAIVSLYNRTIGKLAGVIGKLFGGGGKVSAPLLGPAFASGGPVTSGRTSYGIGKPVPAILHTGEYVLQQSAVRKIGTRKLDALNRGDTGGGTTYNISINPGVFWGREGDARRCAMEIGKYLQLEGAR